MRHDLHMPGFGFGLRPLALEDAEFIVEIRSDRHRTRFLHPIPPSVEAQRDYILQYFERPGDYYFVVERAGEKSREGLIAIYNANLEKKQADWGRWILRPGSLASVESVLRIYEAAFDCLHLDEVRSHTFYENKQVVSFHDHCNLSRRGVIPDYYTIAGVNYDVVEHTLTRGDWPRVRQLLEPTAERVARRTLQS